MTLTELIRKLMEIKNTERRGDGNIDVVIPELMAYEEGVLRRRFCTIADIIDETLPDGREALVIY